MSVTLRLLHYADLEIAYDDPTSMGRLAGAIDELRTPDTVVLGTGDNTAPGALPLAREGRQAYPVFEQLNPAVDVLGNHDFDFGVERAREHVHETVPTWLGANLYEADGTERFAGVAPWTIVETDSYRVGIAGVVHPETDIMNPLAADLDVRPALPAARDAVTALHERDVDAIVLAAHVGGGGDSGPSGSELAERVPVDAVLDGHDHTATVEEMTDGTVYARPGKGADTVTVVEIDGNGTTGRRQPTADYEPDDAIVELLTGQATAGGLTETVRTVQTPIDCGPRAVDAGESQIGNLVTDAFRARADADVAFIAPEGIRSQPNLGGTVTRWDLYALVPFDGDLVSLSLSGEQLRAVLSALTFDHVDAAPDWTFGHVSGAQLTYDEHDRRLTDIVVGGEPLDPDRQYRVATSEYYVENEVLFPMLSAVDVVERYAPQYQVIDEYVSSVEAIPQIEERIRRVSDP